MDNSVLPETKTLVKIWISYVPNVPYVRERPKQTFSRQFVVACSFKKWRLIGFS